ncbi:MAG: ABC transporter ATP-binding protein [Chloroflexi bacterium]|nr:ABC transporter ATP-binding protein [Chloroflexota bacterium]
MLDFLRTLRLMVGLSWASDKPRTIGSVATAGTQMLTIPLRALGIQILVDGITGGDVRRALTGGLLVAALSGANSVMSWSGLGIRMRLREHIQAYLDTYVMDLTAGIPGMEHHERPAYLNHVELVQLERHYIANPFNPISWSVASIFQAVSVLILLAGVHPLLALLPLAGIPSVWINIRGERLSIQLREQSAEPRRVLRHLMELTIEPPAAKEIRIFGLKDVIFQRRREVFDDLERGLMRRGAQNGLLSTLGWACFAICFGLALGFTLHLSALGLITAGQVILVLTLGSQLNVQLAELGWNVAWLVNTQRAVAHLRWLADYAADSARRLLRPRTAPLPERLTDGIRFQGVAFQYPDTERPVLANLNLHIPAGSTVAIVGENGAGKTTLVKLLCRFYEPTAGEILVDGTPLEAFDVAEWRKRISAGFQDFSRIQLLARESIGAGETAYIPDDGRILEALDRASAPDLPRAFPGGLDTQLGRYFEGGVDLSIGQWQKVALGRAMMRREPLLLVLDEPTASLDAPTEHRLFEHFATAASEAAHRTGAITVLVSHRFSTVRMADLIVVVSGGRVVEAGPHAELVRAGGLYAELYQLQAAAYR